MVVMLIAGIHTDLKVRRILRGRLEDEAREEKERIDRNQQDLFQQEQE
jgi:heme exporter protein D